MQESFKTIKVQVRSVYGRELIYPVNDAARAAVKLTGRVTFIKPDLENLAELGHAIEFVPMAIDLSVNKD